jgi:hypothetical protein
MKNEHLEEGTPSNIRSDQSAGHAPGEASQTDVKRIFVEEKIPRKVETVSQCDQRRSTRERKPPTKDTRSAYLAMKHDDDNDNENHHGEPLTFKAPLNSPDSKQWEQAAQLQNGSAIVNKTSGGNVPKNKRKKKKKKGRTRHM